MVPAQKGFRIEHRLPSVEQYLQLRAAAGFSLRSPEAAEAALGNTIHAAVADLVAGPRLVGMARLIGDGGVYFEISDVVVLSDYRGLGIGRALVTDLLDWMAAEAPPTASLRVLTTEDNVGFYGKCGLKNESADVRVFSFRKS